MMRSRNWHGARRLMSVPGVGPITSLAFMAAIEDVGRFGRMRDIGVYLGLTPKRYQSGDTDVALGISHQGARWRGTLSLRGPERAVDHGAQAVSAQELGPETVEAAGTQAGAGGGGTQAVASGRMAHTSRQPLHKGRKRLPGKGREERKESEIVEHRPRQLLRRLGRTGERATCWLQPIKGLRFIQCAARFVHTATGPDDDAG
jgi:hypothetical protein